MSAIVRYTGGRARRYGATVNPYVRAASFAYNNRRAIRTAARTIGVRGAMRRAKRSFKSYRARSAPSAKTTTRQHSTGFEGLSLAPGRLAVNPVNFPPNANTSDGRTGHTIKLSGIKCCYHLENLFDYPLEVHWALVQEKGDQTSIETEKFFREVDSSTSRTRDFDQNPVAWNIKTVCQPINPDKYHILTHKRKIIDGKNQTGGFLKQGRWFWKYTNYFKINKAVTFATPTAIAPERRFLVLVWCQSVGQADFEPNPELDFKILSFDSVYFRSSLT